MLTASRGAGAGPAGELLLGERKADPDPSVRRLALALGELHEPRRHPAERVVGAVHDALSVRVSKPAAERLQEHQPDLGMVDQEGSEVRGDDGEGSTGSMASTLAERG